MKKIALDKDWDFYESDESNSFVFSSPDSIKVDLPHDYIIGKPRSADAPGQAANGYFGNGEGIYKKELDVKSEWEGGHVLLDVDGAYQNLEVVLNGELLGMHPHGYTPYQAELTPALRFDGRKNRLKLITQSRQPSTRWYSGGGLYRNVCLWVGGPVCVKPWDIFVRTPYVSAKEARVRAELVITGEALPAEATVVFALKDTCGREAGSSELFLNATDRTKVSLDITVNCPMLWDVDNPNLYRWSITVYSGSGRSGQVLDEAEGTLGIRRIEADAVNGFRLNGRPMKLKGGCLHHDNGLLGACAYPKAEERKIRILKKAGYNTVRISHYPPSEAMLEICDRLGMLLMDEAFDVWRMGKQPMDYHLYFEDWWERDIEYMIRRDRNHPCVITYSIGNEITERDGKNQGALWARKLADKVRSLDSTRFVISALCGVFSETEENVTNFDINLLQDNSDWIRTTADFCKPLDIVGYNYLRDIYEKSHECFPDRVILGTETHSLTTYDYWEKTEKLPYVIGDCIWAAVDYLGEAGVGRVYWANSGETMSFMGAYPWRTSWQSDIDLTGEQRPQSVYREIMWGHTDRCGLFTTHPGHYGENFFGTDWHWFDVNDCWHFSEEWLGKPVKTDVYGAGDTAEFFLNGRSLGTVAFARLIATMDIPYEPGILEAVVYKDGKELARTSLATPKEAFRLELLPEEKTFAADGKDLSYIRVNMVDAIGCRITDEEREITVSVNGPGTFLAVGSANPCTEDQITAKTCHLYRGTAIVILKSSAPGETTVTVCADGVRDGFCTVEAV